MLKVKKLLLDIKEELEYQYKNLMSNIRMIRVGITNFWKWRKVIYKDRWWDYAFLHEMLKFKLEDMEKNWEFAHYVDSEKEQKELKELIEILEKIEKAEEEFGDVSDLYEEFGHKLFSKRKFTSEDREYETSLILKLWD